jgi:predicted TIM-barrel fold metal-dependent hydrolase
LRRIFSYPAELDDFLADAAGVNIVKSIHVQAEHDRSDPVRETRWLQQIADRPESKGFPQGIVAYADFSRPDVESILEAHSIYPNVRGIRQMLHECIVDAEHPKPCLLDNPVWLRNFKLLRNYGLSFDLQVYSPQMQQARDLACDNPDIQFVLCHTGQPADRSRTGIDGWQRGMRVIAEMPNVCVKISGLGMFDRQWTVDSLRPFIMDAIEIFGVRRCMFGSNFPVDGMMSSYHGLWSAFSEITVHFSDEERHLLFCGNAEQTYRI